MACSHFTPQKKKSKLCETCGEPQSKHPSGRDGYSKLVDFLLRGQDKSPKKKIH